MAAGQQRPEQTHSGEATSPEAPVVGRKPIVSLEIPKPVHIREALGQSEPGSGVRPTDGLDRHMFTHKGEPPGRTTPPTSQKSVNLDGLECTAYTAQPLDRPFGPSYFIP